MKTRARFLMTQALALPLCASLAFAQTSNEPQTIELGPAPSADTEQAQPQPLQQAQPEPLEQLQGQPQTEQPQAQQVFSQQELDQMLAPIALYPDTLLSQILMASTYPIEVVQAARWAKANPGLNGDNAVKAVEQQPWDPSVKSLAAFPNVLSMMDEKLDWMERLGDAFLSQEQQVMDTVQQLRQKAQAAGNLQSNAHVRVEPQGQTIIIEQANPQVVYVPYYDPTVIYGTWWYPAYPPVYWRPWPGYYARPGWSPGFFWGSGVGISTGFFFGRVDWPRRNVTVVNVNNYYYRPAPPRPHGPPPGVWFHDPSHRRGVPYRDPQVRREFGRPNDARPDARRDFRGNPPRVMGPEARPAARQEANRPDTRERVQPRPDNARPDNARPDGARPDNNRANDNNRPNAVTPPRPAPNNTAPNNAAPNNSPQVRPNAVPERGQAQPQPQPTVPPGQAQPQQQQPQAQQPQAQRPQTEQPPRQQQPQVQQQQPQAQRPPVQQPPRQQQPQVQPQQQRPAPAPQVARPAQPQRPATESRPQVFEGVGQGPNVRDSSARGRSSFERISPSNPVARPQAVAPAPRPAAREAPAPRERQGGGGRNNDGQRQQR